MENYTDVSELIALSTLVGGYGMAVIQSDLVRLIAAKAERIKVGPAPKKHCPPIKDITQFSIKWMPMEPAFEITILNRFDMPLAPPMGLVAWCRLS